MRLRNGVHKYETHFQAGRSIYRHTLESTNIPSYFSDMSMRNRGTGPLILSFAVENPAAFGRNPNTATVACPGRDYRWQLPKC